LSYGTVGPSYHYNSKKAATGPRQNIQNGRYFAPIG